MRKLLDVTVGRNPDGEIHSIGGLDEDGSCHGVFIRFGFDGEMISWTEMKNGEIYGRDFFYADSNGKLSHFTTYENDKKQGARRIWVDGILREEASYENGELHGVLRKFGSDGREALTQLWKNGLLICEEGDR